MGLGDFWIHHLCWGITIDSSLVLGESPLIHHLCWGITIDSSLVLGNHHWFITCVGGITIDSSLVLGNHHFWQKITKNTQVGLMTFWFGLVSIWSFKDLWPLIFISVTHWITKMRGKCPLNKIMVKTLISDSLKIVHLCWLLNS
jgi:hypothetical protein